MNIEGIIFDYGGTIDSGGDHWSEVIYDAYRQYLPQVGYAQFRQAYIYAERYVAANRVILPQDNFYELMLKKVNLQLGWLAENGGVSVGNNVAEPIARYCYEHAGACIDKVRPGLEALHARYPMVLVSNFYGNIDSVLRDYGLRHLFCGVIESAMVGVRKPDPRIFAMGCLVLDLPPQQVLVVGDSVSKDLVPARSLGCATAFIGGRQWRGEPEPAEPAVTIAALAREMLADKAGH